MTVKTLFIPRRLLCDTENLATGNETIPLLDLKEPLNVLACNAGKLLREFYEDLLQEEKYFLNLAFTLSIDIDSNQPVVVVTQCELTNHLPLGLVFGVQVTITGHKYVVHMRKWESGELDG